MPGMSGTELAATLCRKYPGLSVIYMSGYMTEVLAEDALRPGTNFIAKPFHNDALRDFVARVLAVPSASVG
ncbi:MAG TPA: response regulator, partial [Polyangiaceae bacterium]